MHRHLLKQNVSKKGGFNSFFNCVFFLKGIWDFVRPKASGDDINDDKKLREKVLKKKDRHLRRLDKAEEEILKAKKPEIITSQSSIKRGYSLLIEESDLEISGSDSKEGDVETGLLHPRQSAAQLSPESIPKHTVKDRDVFLDQDEDQY